MESTTYPALRRQALHAGDRHARRLVRLRLHPRRRLIGALNAAAEYHFIRTVSVYGAAVLPLLERLDWSGSARWKKQLMDDVRLQAANRFIINLFLVHI